MSSHDWAPPSPLPHKRLPAKAKWAAMLWALGGASYLAAIAVFAAEISGFGAMDSGLTDAASQWEVAGFIVAMSAFWTPVAAPSAVLIIGSMRVLRLRVLDPRGIHRTALALGVPVLPIAVLSLVLGEKSDWRSWVASALAATLVAGGTLGSLSRADYMRARGHLDPSEASVEQTT